MTSTQAPTTRADTTTLMLDALYDKLVEIIATQQEHGGRLAEILHTQEIHDANTHFWADSLSDVERRFQRVEDNQRKHLDGLRGQDAKLDEVVGLLRTPE